MVGPSVWRSRSSTTCSTLEGDEASGARAWARIPDWGNGLTRGSLGIDGSRRRAQQSPTRPWRRLHHSALAATCLPSWRWPFWKGIVDGECRTRCSQGSGRRLTSKSCRRKSRSARRRDATELIGVVGRRSAHFASNLGVVELCLALHLTFDFSKDRLIWDTGHQIYPHKLITGRCHEFHTIRTKGGLMGYPNPAESPYDLFMTGHAGAALDQLGVEGRRRDHGPDRRQARGRHRRRAFPSGLSLKLSTMPAELSKKMLVILNDNQMSICPRVGGICQHLDPAACPLLTTTGTSGSKPCFPASPWSANTPSAWFQQFKDAIKASLHHGMLFEELGFTYLGPIDGHDLKCLRTYLEKVKAMDGPILLHVLTNKGHGFEPAVKDPVKFHAPALF